MSNTISKLISKTVPTNLSTAFLVGGCALGFAVSATAAPANPIVQAPNRALYS